MSKRALTDLCQQEASKFLVQSRFELAIPGAIQVRPHGVLQLRVQVHDANVYSRTCLQAVNASNPNCHEQRNSNNSSSCVQP
jgi:hypothetical protein